MKRTKAIGLLLVLLAVGACGFLAYRLSHPPQPPTRLASQQATATQCDQNLWQYVYHPDRLQVLNPCLSVTGVVDEVRNEPDGDFHIRFHLDQQFASLLNQMNISGQQGDLVLEPICQGKVTQADAVQPCKPYAGPHFQPQVGQRYLVWGAHVNDTVHGWNELHPVSSMQPIP
jgi:hypothetical protein